MYKKIEEYCWCNIYKHINAGIYIAALSGEKIAQGSYINVKEAIRDHWAKNFSRYF